MQVKLELVHQVSWDVRHGQCCNVLEVIGGVIRLQCEHRNLVFSNAQTVSDTLWKVVKDLVSGATGPDNEGVVQAIVETNLNQGSVVWLIGHTVGRLNDTRHACWNTGWY